MDVELHRLGTRTLAGVLDRHCEGDAAVLIHAGRGSTQIAESECGVAQSVSEGKEGMGLLLVGPAIAHIDAFLVLLVDDVALGRGTTLLAPHTRIGIQSMCTHIGQ